MAVHDPTAELEQERRRELRRFIVYSVVGHALLLLGLTHVPEPRSSLTPRGVISVRLVDPSALGAAPAPPAPKPKPEPPKPKPEPLPPPEPEVKPKPRPPVEEVVLPEEPSEPEPKPEPKPVPEPAEPAPEPEPEVEYDDVLAQLREEQGEETPAAEQTARAGVPGRPDGTPIDAEHAAWIRRAKLHVTRNWVLAPGFRTQPLSTRVTVRLDPQGRVLGSPRVTDSSGNPWYDESALRAIEKSDPLPPPPEPGEWSFLFRPEDLY